MYQALVTAQDLTKTYKGKNQYVLALNHISFSIEPGRIIGLLGPNGSGKSTLIKLIAGLLTPSSGSVYVHGETPGINSKLSVAYLPDSCILNENLKISELVTYFKDFYSNFDSEKAYAMLERLHVDKNKKFKTLSKGTKDKVQLVLTMSRNADLYLLDEPIGGVDPAARDYILDTILTQRSPNSTILISTHLITDIEHVLDEALIFNQGNLEHQLKTSDLADLGYDSYNAFFREVYKC